MQTEKNYPLHSHYLLLNNRTKKAFNLTLSDKIYTFIASREYFLKLKLNIYKGKVRPYISKKGAY